MPELSQSRQSYFFNNPEAKVQRRENLEQVRFPRYITADDGSGSPLRDVHLAKQLGQCCSFSSLRSMAFRPDQLIEVVREAVRVISPTLPPAAGDLVTRYALQRAAPMTEIDQIIRLMGELERKENSVFGPVPNGRTVLKSDRPMPGTVEYPSPSTPNHGYFHRNLGESETGNAKYAEVGRRSLLLPSLDEFAAITLSFGTSYLGAVRHVKVHVWGFLDAAANGEGNA